MLPSTLTPTNFPYTTLFRSFGRELSPLGAEFSNTWKLSVFGTLLASVTTIVLQTAFAKEIILFLSIILFILSFAFGFRLLSADRKSTRLNSSHVAISYAVFC